jgi:Icc protein
MLVLAAKRLCSMKIIHISNINLNPYSSVGSESVERFTSVARHVERFNSDADHVVITGGLSQYGESAGYRQFNTLLERCSLKGTLKPKLLMGNGDSREHYSSVFPKIELDFNGFNQWVEKTASGWLVFLDTALVGKNSGHFCDRRIEWLTHVLDAAAGCDAAVFLFMHHNPVPVRIGTAQSVSVRQIDKLHVLLRNYRNTIKHIFYGQGYSPLSRPIYGISLSVPRSPSCPWRTQAQNTVVHADADQRQLAYNVCTIERSNVQIQEIGFRHPVQEAKTVLDDFRCPEDIGQSSSSAEYKLPLKYTKRDLRRVKRFAIKTDYNVVQLERKNLCS